MNNGWIKLYRILADKPIWHDSSPEQKTILITLLMMANNQTREWEWKGKPYKANPGQFVTSLPSIVQRAGKGITIQNVRTALKRFEKYGFLTDESTKQNRLITIANWAKYQGQSNDPNRQTNSQLTDDQQTPNSQLTANKNLRTKELRTKELKDIVEQPTESDPETQKRNAITQQVIDYLNKKSGKSFSGKSKDARKLISGRLSEGRTFEDFKTVIDNKVEDWLNDSERVKYLRPSTLFRPSKFDEYLNEKPVNSTGKGWFDL